VSRVLQRFLSFILLFSVGFADEYSLKWEFSLQKDEPKKILVKYEGEKKLLVFRWTLYVNGGLVVLRSYNSYVAQNILALNHKNQTFRVQIKPRAANAFNVPYILVKFKEFDTKKDQAKFELYLYDTEATKIWLEEIKKKSG